MFCCLFSVFLCDPLDSLVSKRGLSCNHKGEELRMTQGTQHIENGHLPALNSRSKRLDHHQQRKKAILEDHFE